MSNDKLFELAAGTGETSENRARDELIDFLLQDGDLKRVLKAHGASRQKLVTIFGTLRSYGAGQVVAGHYVPASTLAFGATLDYVLRKDASPSTDWTGVASRLVDYFAHGEVGFVD